MVKDKEVKGLRGELLGGPSTWLMMSPIIKRDSEMGGGSGMEMQ